MNAKIYTALTLILVVANCVHSQNTKNPFQKFGYDVLTATLSKGEFEEFHDLSEIVEIGSVLYNTKTKEIVKILEQDSTTIDIPAATAAMSIDPHCERYYWISPYVYAANNPIKFVDPDGRDIWLYYEDDEGKEQKMLYTAGMNYSGNNSFVSNTISYLNALNDNGGSTMLGELISSSNSFNFKNQLPTDSKGNIIQDALQFDGFDSGGGNIYAGALMSSGRSQYSNIENVSHELFHGLQHEKGQGGASIFNEVEAYIYSGIIATNWMSKTDYVGGLSSNGIGTGTPEGTIYQQSFNQLQSGFSEKSLYNAVRNFKVGAENNSTGLYNNYPLIRSNQTKHILKQYFPIIPK